MVVGQRSSVLSVLEDGAFGGGVVELSRDEIDDICKKFIKMVGVDEMIEVGDDGVVVRDDDDEAEAGVKLYRMNEILSRLVVKVVEAKEAKDEKEEDQYDSFLVVWSFFSTLSGLKEGKEQQEQLCGKSKVNMQLQNQIGIKIGKLIKQFNDLVLKQIETKLFAS